MRYSLFFKAFILGSLVFIFSCKKEPGTLDSPYRRDVPVLLATRISSYDLREVHFSFDIAVFKANNEINEIQEFLGLPDSSFKFVDYETTNLTAVTWVRFHVEKSEYVDTIPQHTFSTVFLIDQSASPENFDSTDYWNSRFQAFNAFYRNLNGLGNVAFSSYKRTSTSHDVVTFLNPEFSSAWDPVTAKSLLDLTHQQSGTSGLYDALEQAIDHISSFNSPNKSVTLFVRNKDDGNSKLTLSEVIALANEKGIKINVVWLIHETENVDLKALRQLSARTGGFSVYMSSIYQSSTVFQGLAKILRMEMSFYRVHANMTIEEPNYFATAYSSGMYLYYYVSEFYNWSYIPFYLEKP